MPNFYNTRATGQQLDQLPDVIEKVNRIDQEVSRQKEDIADLQATTEQHSQDIEELKERVEDIGGADSETIGNHVADWLEKHPEATTTVQDGSITEEKIAPSLKAKLGASSSAMSKKLIGMLYPAPMNYTAWSRGSLRYDPHIDKYVDILHCTDRHVNPTDIRMYVVYIDPMTLDVSEPVRCVFPDEVTTTRFTAWWIDGEAYYTLQNTTSGIAKLKSEDNGVNWVVDGSTNLTGIGSIDPYEFRVISTGRILMSVAGVNAVYYSDDKGLNWTSVRLNGLSTATAEATFVEVGGGRLLAICRYSMSGIGYNSSGASEHAYIAKSEDYGASWSNCVRSTTIDDMNASSGYAFVHGGSVELFASSRWYWHGTNSNVNFDNTGKAGAINHYTASLENAWSDNWTKLDPVAYSKAIGDTSSQDFGFPCVAMKNEENGLLVYMDRDPSKAGAENANHCYANVSLVGLDFGVRDDKATLYSPYSSKKVEAIVAKAKSDLLFIIKNLAENIGGGGGDIEIPDDPDSYVLASGNLVYYFDMTDESSFDKSAMTVTDKKNGVVGKLVTSVNGSTSVSAFPVYNENRMNMHTGVFMAIDPIPDAVDDATNSYTIEVAVYNDVNAGDTAMKLTYYMLTADGGGADSYKPQVSNLCYAYKNTSGVFTKNMVGAPSGVSVYSASRDINKIHHYACVYDSDGKAKLYINGTFMYEASYDDFNGWIWSNKLKRVLEVKHSYAGNINSVRMYSRALTAEEVMNNYNYTLQNHGE